MVADMVGNKKLDSIGVVARSLRQQLKLIDRLHGDDHGMLLALDYVKRAHSQATVREDTVVFTVLFAEAHERSSQFVAPRPAGIGNCSGAHPKRARTHRCGFD